MLIQDKTDFETNMIIRDKEGPCNSTSGCLSEKNKTIILKYMCTHIFIATFFKGFIYVFLDRGERWEKEKGRNINCGCLSRTSPRLGTQPATQACAPTGNQTSDPLVHKPVLNPLSHTSQGYCNLFYSRHDMEAT